jgi:hypothetical protein
MLNAPTMKCDGVNLRRSVPVQKRQQIFNTVPVSHSGSPAFREFDLSSAKPILPMGRKRELVSPQQEGGVRGGPRLPSHPIRPGLVSKLCSALARRRQLGSASSSNKHTPSVVRRRTTGGRARIRSSNPGAAAQVPSSRSNFNSSMRMRRRILPDQRSLAGHTAQRTGRRADF